MQSWDNSRQQFRQHLRRQYIDTLFKHNRLQLQSPIATQSSLSTSFEEELDPLLAQLHNINSLATIYNRLRECTAFTAPSHSWIQILLARLTTDIHYWLSLALSVQAESFLFLLLLIYKTAAYLLPNPEIHLQHLFATSQQLISSGHRMRAWFLPLDCKAIEHLSSGRLQ